MRLVYLYCSWGWSSDTADGCLYRVWADADGKIIRGAWPWSRWFAKPERFSYHGYAETNDVARAVKAKRLPNPPTP